MLQLLPLVLALVATSAAPSSSSPSPIASSAIAVSDGDPFAELLGKAVVIEKPSMPLSNLPLLALLTRSGSTDLEPYSRLERLDLFAAKLRLDLARELQSVQSELGEESDGRKAQLLLVAQLQRLRGDHTAVIATDAERIAPKQDSHTRLWLAAELYWNQVEQHTYPWGTRNETSLDYQCLDPTSRPDIGLSPR